MNAMMSSMNAPSQGQMPGPMDMSMLLQQLGNPLQSAMAPQQPPMDPLQAALMSLLTNGGQMPPTTAQTPDLMALIQMLSQGMGQPMGMGAGMMAPTGGVPPMY